MTQEKFTYEIFLQHMRSINDKYQWIAKETGEQFNVFSILNMERLECRTHSAFLYELLNPMGSHGQGEAYLKAFIEDVLEISSFEYNQVSVERERSIGEWGRMDLVIENAEQIVIIENKIDALDQKEQLFRYWEYAKQTGKEYYIYYLTLEGYEASDISLGKGKNKVEYWSISYKIHILKWLRRILGIGNTPVLPIVRETIRQYIKLVEKLTNQGDRNMRNELTQLLVQSNYLEMAELIAETIPYAKATLEYRFWEKYEKTIHQKLLKLGLEEDEMDFIDEMEEGIEYIVQIRNKKKNGFSFGYKLGKKNKHKLMLFIGEDGYDSTLYISILVEKENQYISVEDWQKKLLNTVESIGFNSSNTDNSSRYMMIEEKINFNDRKDLEVLKDERLTDQLMEKIQKQVVSIVKALLKNEVIREYID